VLALKKAEESDEIILRMVELDGKAAQDVRVSFAGPIVAAREVNAQEQPLGRAEIRDGELVTSFTSYQPRTFALRLGPPTTTLAPVRSHPVKLKYDLAVATNDDTETSGGGFDGTGKAMPAEMLPSRIDYQGTEFELAPAKTDTPNAMVARGQTIALPEGHFNRIYVLAASADGDQDASFYVGNTKVGLRIQDWTGFVGQWDTRLWKNQSERDWAISANHAVWPPADMEEREKRPASPRYPDDYVGLRPGYVKPASIAWYASHLHTAKGLNQPYQYSYLFAYALDASGNPKTLTLPSNDKIHILAISTADENPVATATQSLYTALNGVEPPSASGASTP
jgi:alpha-mannosidase